MQQHDYFLIGFILIFAFWIWRTINNTHIWNQEYRKMEELSNMYKAMLDECKTIYQTIDVELKFKEYMSQYKNDGKQRKNGYEQFMNDFEAKLFKTKVKLNK